MSTPLAVLITVYVTLIFGICFGASLQANVPFLLMLKKFLYDYQTLIGVLAAIGAAFYAGRPVWRQTALQTLQDLRMRSTQLHNERMAILTVRATLQHCDEQINAAIGVVGQAAARLGAGNIIQGFNDHAKLLSDATGAFGNIVGIPWGTTRTQSARNAAINATHNYASDFMELARSLPYYGANIATPIQNQRAGLEEGARQVTQHTQQVLDAIDREVARIGQWVAELENRG